MTFKKGSGIQLTKNFNSNEFDCKCNTCTETKLSFQLVLLLQQVRDQFKVPIKISSGYRCETHNANVGGVPNSQHLRGYAADVQSSTIKPSDIAAACENLFSGLGRYGTFTHIDVRETKARW